MASKSYRCELPDNQARAGPADSGGHPLPPPSALLGILSKTVERSPELRSRWALSVS
jgi:hypothetical protein